MAELNTIQRGLYDWARRKFPDQTSRTVMDHLVDQVGQLAQVERAGDAARIADNIADVLILTLVLASVNDVNAALAISRVHGKNQGAEYRMNDAKGFHERVKP